ncbi:MAG: uncharacterized protein KVP18_004516 [Porospora cf. gigantea A]|uniref:uncharacterized protein n=1 Tax=Porospora cf. gigantea A TaxID=2853593 RepID=UPI003559A2C9|nr:MAG: hypothetical protein KVP18_004516 [Porospora cf. gigantea A]
MHRSRPYEDSDSNRRRSLSPPPVTDNDPLQLTSFRHYLLNHPELDVDEAKSEYITYKENFLVEYHATALRENLKLALIKDSFHPRSIRELAAEKCIIAKKRAATFVSNMETFGEVSLRAPAEVDDVMEVHASGEFQPVQVSANDLKLNLDALNAQSADVLPPPFITGAPYFAIHPSSASLMIMNVPASVSRWDIISFLEESNIAGVAEVACTVENLDEIQHFVTESLGMSDRQTPPQLKRNCYVAFASVNMCELAEDALMGKEIRDDFTATVTRLTTPFKVLVRVIPTFGWSVERIERDMHQSRRLMKLLDERYQLDFLWESEQDHFIVKLEGQVPQFKILDLQMLYLRYVHSVDYYSGQRFDSLREMSEKCGTMHVRPFVNLEDPTIASRSPTPEEEVFFGALDSQLEQLIHSLEQPIVEEFTEDHSAVQEAWELELQGKCLEQETDRWQCAQCDKVFRGKEFVSKHIRNKHSELLEKICEEMNFHSMQDVFNEDPDARWLLPVPVIGERTEDRQIYHSGPVRRGRHDRHEYRDWDEPVRPPCLGNVRHQQAYDDL